MWRNPLRSFRHIGSADYIRRCCSSLRELRTSVNLQNPKNGSKLPSRDFANPPNRCKQPLTNRTCKMKENIKIFGSYKLRVNSDILLPKKKAKHKEESKSRKRKNSKV